MRRSHAGADWLRAIEQFGEGIFITSMRARSGTGARDAGSKRELTTGGASYLVTRVNRLACSQSAQTIAEPAGRGCAACEVKHYQPTFGNLQGYGHLRPTGVYCEYDTDDQKVN